jgi:hypothetical protein
MDFECQPGARRGRHGQRYVLGCFSLAASRHASELCASATGARDHGTSSRCVRGGGGGGIRRGPLCHYQRLYWRIGCAQEIPRNHAKTSRRAIQCVLRARTRLRQGRRCPATRPHRPCGRAALSVERGAAWLAAGLLAAVALLALQRLVLPAVHWLDDTRAFGILQPRLHHPDGQSR